MPNPQDILNPLQEQNLQPGTPVTNEQWAQGTPVSDQLWKALSQTNSSPNLGTKYATPYSDVDVSGRYATQAVGMENEDLFGKGQSSWARLGNSLAKSTGIATTTFLNGTAGLIYGIGKSLDDGKMSSLYDNEFTRSLDGINAELENKLPFYKTNAESNQNWFSPGSYLTENFWLDGVLKNAGFMAGAALSGGVYASALKALPLTAKLFSIGKSAELLAATEEAMTAGKATEAIGQVKALSDKFLGSYNTLNKAGRAVVSFLGTTGEAGMEAYNNSAQFRDSLIKDYTDKNGQAPSGEQLEKINSYADNVGNASFAMNVALLTATNYIQFPKILGSSYELEKSELNHIINTNPIVKDAETGLFKSGLPEKGISKRLVQAKNVGELLFAPSEAFEEGAQYGIQTGTQNYYNKKYEGKDANFLDDVIGYGTTQALTTQEGILNIMSGGLSGGLMMSGLVGRKDGKFGVGKTGNIGERGFTGYGGELAANTEEAVKAFNQSGINKFTKDGVDAVNRGTVLQQEREAAIRQGDILEAKDLEYDYIHNYLTPRIKYDRFDLVNSDIADNTKLAATQEGFQQLQDEGVASQFDTRERFLSRLSNLQNYATNLNSLYQSLNVRYSGQLNDKGDRVYNDATIDKMAYAASKVADYDGRLPKLMQSLIPSGIDVQGVINDVAKKNTVSLQEAITHIDNLDVLSDVKDEYKENIMDAAELTARRQKFLREYDAIKKNPSEYEDRQPEPTKEENIAGRSFTPNKQKEYTSRKAEDDTYNVVSPTGEIISNHDTKEAADTVRDTENTKLPPVGDKIEVVRKTDTGLYEVKDSTGKTYYLSPNILQNYTPIKTEEEVVKEREDFNKKLFEQINNANSKNATGYALNTPEEVGFVGTAPKKSINNVFRSTTYNIKSQRDYIPRQQYFLSNFDKVASPEEVKVMIVTPKNADSLGLKGLYDYLLDTPALKKEYGVENTNKFPLVTLVVRKTKDKSYFLSAQGENIGEVGIDVDINNIVYGVLPTADPSFRTPTNDGKFEERYVAEKTTPEEVALHVNSYISDRENIAKWGEQTEFFDFGISRGRALYTENFAPNSVVGSLITKEDLSSQDIIKVSDGSIQNFEGEDINFKAGVPYIKKGSTIQPLTNEALTKERTELLFKVLTTYTEEYNKEKKDASKIKRLENYLQGILYNLRPQEGKEVGNNQIWLDEEGMFNFSSKGKVPFTPTAFRTQEKSIKKFLSEMYHITNNKYLTTEEPFEEVTDISNGEISSIQWKNYRHYLLSDTYDLTKDDSSPLKDKQRDISTTPLTTAVRSLSKDTPLNTNYFYKSIVVKPNTSTGLFSVNAPKKASTLIVTKGGNPSKANDLLSSLGTQAGIQDAEVVLEVEWTKTNIGEDKFINFRTEGNDVIIEGNSYYNDKGEATPLTDEQVVKFTVAIASSVFGQPTVQEEKKSLSKLEQLKLKKKEDINNLPSSGYGEQAYRVITDNLNYTAANIEEEASYIEDVLGLPVHRVNNLIQTTSGGYAFGMFKDAAIYLYKGAEVGTGYHEAFEAVYHMYTSPKERENLLNEFKSREGVFTDRVSGNSIKYSQANDYQAKEQLAEEFRDYILSNKEIKPSGNAISRFFKELYNFIKNLLPNNSIQNLFDRINSGYYKGMSPYTSLSEEQYRSIPDVTAKQRHTVINGVVSEVFQKIFAEQRNLTDFDEKSYNIQDIYQKVYEELDGIFISEDIKDSIPSLVSLGKITDAQYNQYTSLWENLQKNWSTVTELVNQKLKTYDIIANLTGEDINDLIESNETLEKEADNTSYEGGKNADSYVQDAFKYDFKKNASTSVKLLISTLIETSFNEDNSVAIPQLDTDTHMKRMVAYNKTFNKLMGELYNYNTFNDKVKAIQQLAIQYSNYLPLARRLKLGYDNKQLTIEDWKLRTKLYNVTSKQRPDSFITYIAGNEVYTESANLNTIARNYVNDWLSALKERHNGVVTKSPEGVYEFNGDKIKGFKIAKVGEQVDFLNALAIPFTEELYNKLNKRDKDTFYNNVKGLYKYLPKNQKTRDITPQSLNANNNFNKIAELYIRATGQDFESTFYNIEGERIQQYPLNNYISVINNDINNVTSLEDLVNINPQLGNPLTKDSIYLNELLFNEGKRTSLTLNTGYIQGYFNRGSNKALPNSKLSYADRVLLEVNQNLNKNYYILVPADSKTEWMLSMEHVINYNEVGTPQGEDKIYRIFNTYYQTERNNGANGFMKEINGNYDTESLEREKLFTYLNQRAEATKQLLKNNNKIVNATEDTYYLNGVDTKFKQKNSLGGAVTDSQLDEFFKFTETNYAINNIEIHKLYFGDPSVIKDPLKRYKSFLSPREVSMHSTPEVNDKLNQELNKATNIALNEEDYGYFLHKDYMRTATMADPLSIEDNIFNDEHIPEQIREQYKGIEGTDAQSWSTIMGHREILWKAGRWSNEQEDNFQYLMAQDRLLLEEDNKYTYTNPKLKSQDEKLVSGGLPNNSTIPILKPIGSGYTQDDNLFLHKTSLFPIFYAAVRGTNLAEHYMQMVNNGLSYIIVKTGAKIGAGELTSFYTEEGENNISGYKQINNIPFKYYGIQVETSGQKDKNPLGTQLSKLATVNLISEGVPLNESIGKKIERNTTALKNLQTNGYYKLLNTFGIVDNGNSYSAPDKSRAITLIQSELFRRDAPENVRDMIRLGEDGDFITPLESLSNYDQIKSILYSYVEKVIAKPKLNGGPQIQVSGTLWEKGVRPVKDVNGKQYYTSTGLKFYSAEYKDGERVGVNRMEVMLPMWFAKQIKSSPFFKDNTEEEILEYINKNNKELLNGVGFRIPTQDTNSVEAFTVVGFIPAIYSNTVVVPEAITKKAGSDFDVDKLSTYLKNIYITPEGEIKKVPYFGVGEEARAKLTELVDAIKEGDELAPLPKYIPSIEQLENILDSFDSQIDRLYTQSLENEYFESLEELILEPINYERLIVPNSSKEMIDLRDELVKIAPNEFTNSNTDKSILDRGQMSAVRHANLVAKGGVGIAAVQQTNNALNQLGVIYLNPEGISNIPKWQRAYVKNVEVLLPHNSVNVNGKEVGTLSKSTDIEGKYISDKISQYINGYVDITKDSFISDIGATTNTASTFLTLEKLGVPTDTVVYFMNQPIIREFLKELGRNNQTWLYNSDYIQWAKELFPDKKNLSLTEFNTRDLKENIRKYYNGEKLSPKEQSEQRVILDEFLKYSIFASHIFDMTRGTSYDTDSSGDPNMQYRKQALTQKALTQNLFSSAQTLLDKSFLGNTAELVGDASQAISESFTVIDQPEVRQYTNQILSDVVNLNRSANDYQKIARAVEQSLITHAIQTDKGINTRAKELLSDTSHSIASRVNKMKDTLSNKPNSDLAKNLIINQLVTFTRSNINQAKVVTLLSKPIAPEDVDNYADAMRELKNNPLTSSLYNDLVEFSFLQSGISRSPISFMEFIPAEDYIAITKEVIQKLPNLPLQEWVDLDSFYRNSWKNNTIIPSFDEKVVDEEYFVKYKSRKRPKWWVQLLKSKDIEEPMYIPFAVSEKSGNARSKYVTVNLYKPKQDTPTQILLKRLDDEFGEPIATPYSKDPTYGDYYMYFPINAWGDGFYAQEYYTSAQPSVLNNSTFSPGNELPFSEILAAYKGEVVGDITQEVKSVDDKIDKLVEQGVIKKDCK